MLHLIIKKKIIKKDIKIIEEDLKITEEVINFIMRNRKLKKKIDSLLMMDNKNVGAEKMNPSMNMIIKKE
jgi:hypothetical protein